MSYNNFEEYGYSRCHRGYRRHKIPKFFHPSYLVSFMIPSRQYYCDKCNYYLEHRFSSRWKDNLKPGSSCVNKCNCSQLQNNE